MKWQEIVRQLHALHAMAQLRIDEIERLNSRLFKILGRNYCDLPPEIIKGCVGV